MRKLFILLLLSFIFSLSSCKTDFSAADTYEIQLTLESAEVTEAWLKLSALPPDARATYTVKRDTHTVFEGKLDKADTLIHDTGLEPAADYEYRAFINQQIIKSANLQITTMDTTSHDFSWQTFEFGGVNGSSVFHDVAIISPENIWAVGEIHTADTDCWNEDSTEWLPAYNAAHWDGENWELRRVRFKGNPVEVPPIKTLYTFSENNIFFTNGGSFVHFNGLDYKYDFSINSLLNGAITKIWGTSINDIYAVGNKGTIAHYNGKGWTKIESGTDVEINDIWGCDDKQTSQNYILSTVSKKLHVSDYKLLQINIDNSVSELDWPFPDRTPYSLWFKNKNNIFITGEGIRMRNRIGQWKVFSRVTSYFKNRIRGTEINDIFVCGDYGFLAHFNGRTWKTYNEVSGHAYLSLDYKDDLLVAVGHWNPAARILLMKRK